MEQEDTEAIRSNNNVRFSTKLHFKKIMRLYLHFSSFLSCSLYFSQIVFDYPDEVLTHITGTCGPLMYMGPSIIRSITFHTNRGKHGPFGEEEGPSFTSKSKEGKIVGFHGRSGLFIDAIGIHMIEGKVTVAALPPANKNYKTEADLAEVEYPQWSNKLAHVKQRPAEEVLFFAL